MSSYQFMGRVVLLGGVAAIRDVLGLHQYVSIQVLHPVKAAFEDQRLSHFKSCLKCI